MAQQPHAPPTNFEDAKLLRLQTGTRTIPRSEKNRCAHNEILYSQWTERDRATFTFQYKPMTQALTLMYVKDLVLKQDLVTFQGILHRKKWVVGNEVSSNSHYVLQLPDPKPLLKQNNEIYFLVYGQQYRLEPLSDSKSFYSPPSPHLSWKNRIAVVLLKVKGLDSGLIILDTTLCRSSRSTTSTEQTRVWSICYTLQATWPITTVQ